MSIVVLIRLCSWLIDVSKDAEGFRVIVDLHGGDEQNEMAQAEYTEIKDRVMFEVRMYVPDINKMSDRKTSVNPVKVDRTLSCGGSISVESY